MRRLHLLRHADAESDARGGNDHDRSLSPRGRLAAAFIGGHLSRSSRPPQLVLCSTARRAVETWEAIRPFLAATPEVYAERGLYLAPGDALLERVCAVDDDHSVVLLVGHNPGLGQLAFDLARPVATPEFDRLARSFPTASLVTLRFDADRWAEVRPGQARLEEFTLPNSIADPR